MKFLWFFKFIEKIEINLQTDKICIALLQRNNLLYSIY